MTQYRSPLLPIDQMPQVDLESMNQTHREELELINGLAALVAAGIEGEVDEHVVTDRVDAWLEHTRRHFARENELMEKYAFPAYPVHRAEHDRLLGVIETLQQNWRKEHALQPLAQFLFSEWPAWFDNHVQTMDRVTASFLRQQGVSG